jgi:hypothetical protein
MSSGHEESPPTLQDKEFFLEMLEKYAVTRGPDWQGKPYFASSAARSPSDAKSSSSSSSSSSSPSSSSSSSVEVKASSSSAPVGSTSDASENAVASASAAPRVDDYTGDLYSALLQLLRGNGHSEEEAARVVAKFKSSYAGALRQMSLEDMDSMMGVLNSHTPK